MYLQVNDLRQNSQRMLFKYQGINRETAGEGCFPDACHSTATNLRVNSHPVTCRFVGKHVGREEAAAKAAASSLPTCFPTNLHVTGCEFTRKFVAEACRKG